MYFKYALLLCLSVSLKMSFVVELLKCKPLASWKAGIEQTPLLI